MFEPTLIHRVLTQKITLSYLQLRVDSKNLLGIFFFQKTVAKAWEDFTVQLIKIIISKVI